MHAKKQFVPSETRVAVDIGSTVVNIARIGHGDELITQDFYPRDFDTGIAKQIESLLDQLDTPFDEEDILVCSSANGGLRVGIVCLTKHFSGTTLRNQALSAGANPIFVHDFDEEGGDLRNVDILLVGGGICCPDAEQLLQRLKRFKPDNYRFASLIYAGNQYLADLFTELFPATIVISNPVTDALQSRTNSVFEALRSAYLDDLVYKEGVSELRNNLATAIHPTPEVVNRGFQRAVFNCSSIEVAGACILFDIGGATTDIHYTVEIVHDDSDDRPAPGSSVARYVFTDLGIVASQDSTLMQMRRHPRIYAFLNAILDDYVQEVFRQLREGEYSPSAKILSYACLFIGLDRFSEGRGSGLPAVDLGKVTQIILTGGAAQSLDNCIVARIVELFLADQSSSPGIYIDTHYQVWIDGITWGGHSAV